MDEFFAAVEKLDNPSLRGKPLLIGGDPKARGVVSTASYEAREFGCHSAMPMARAVRMCPRAIVLPGRGRRYAEISEQVFEIFRRFSPMVEPLSVDEAFIDVSGCERLLGPAPDIGHQIKRQIRSEVGIVCSVGVAHNKFLAKIGSDLDKPDGFVEITEENVHTTLDPLKVEKLWGVGPAAAKVLHKLNIHTVGQLRAASLELLRDRMGDGGEHLWRLARGEDSRPVTPDSRAKSVGQEQTFAVNVSSSDELLRVLLNQCEQVARRLRRSGMCARTITLKLRYSDFTTITRAKTLPEATNVTEILWRSAKEVFAKWSKSSFRALRLIGFTASQLGAEGVGQGTLFAQPDSERHKKIDEAVDEITRRFGDSAIGRAKGMPEANGLKDD